MLIGPQPPHDLGEYSRVDGNATRGRVPRADVKKEPRPRALHDGMTVVVDHDGVGVGRASLVEVLRITSGRSHVAYVAVVSGGGRTRVPPAVDARAKVWEPRSVRRLIPEGLSHGVDPDRRATEALTGRPDTVDSHVGDSR